MIRTKRIAKHAAHAVRSAPTPLSDEELGAVSGADKKPVTRPADPTPTESVSFVYSSVQLEYHE